MRAAPPPRKPRYESLDGLRGVSAVVVVLFHASFNSPVRDLALVQHGWLFVDFFFVLSGFIIAENYGDRITDRRSFARFVTLRLGRLYPLHLAVLAAYVAYETLWWAAGDSSLAASRTAFSGNNSPDGLIASLLLIHSFGLQDHLTWNTPSWSIGAEFFAYLLFAGVLLSAGRRRAVVPLVILALVAAIACTSLGPFEEQTYKGFPRCIGGFAIGALVSLGRVRMRGSTMLEIAVVGLIGLFVVAAPEPVQFAAALVFAIAVATFAAEGGAISSLLKSAPFRFLGAASYSIYMVHIFVLQIGSNVVTLVEKLTGLALHGEMGADGKEMIGANAWQGNSALLLYVAAVIITAAVTYRWIEVPARSWTRRWCDRRLPAAAPAGSELAHSTTVTSA